MRKIITILALLLISASSNAADWVDQGDGTWDLGSITLTAPTTAIKNQFEQVRAGHNYRYRYLGDQLSASDWITQIAVGIDATQIQGTAASPPKVLGFAQKLWKAFKRLWLTKQQMAGSADHGDTEGLAVSVPAPPAAP